VRQLPPRGDEDRASRAGGYSICLELLILNITPHPKHEGSLRSASVYRTGQGERKGRALPFNALHRNLSGVRFRHCCALGRQRAPLLPGLLVE
jgi:hypothetical protein